ncbi:hypothetical protein IP79_12815 [Porphyrobacter sp. AAP60]|nr:hypothetical protein IP79_12815 [Porphyrobacter sp. AAP60]
MPQVVSKVDSPHHSANVSAIDREGFAFGPAHSEHRPLSGRFELVACCNLRFKPAEHAGVDRLAVGIKHRFEGREIRPDYQADTIELRFLCERDCGIENIAARTNGCSVG